MYGETVNYSWYFPTNTSLTGSQDVIVGSGVELTKLSPDSVLSFGTVDFSNDTILMRLGYEPTQSGISFSAASFTGFKITDTYNQVPNIVGVTLVQNGGNVGLDQSDISFDANHVSLNLAGLSFNYASVIELHLLFA